MPVRTKDLSIPQLLELLETASKELKECRETERMASSNATAAHNRLNNLQKEFDERVRNMKENSPSGSDWKRALVSRNGS